MIFLERKTKTLFISCGFHVTFWFICKIRIACQRKQVSDRMINKITNEIKPPQKINDQMDICSLIKTSYSMLSTSHCIEEVTSRRDTFSSCWKCLSILSLEYIYTKLRGKKIILFSCLSHFQCDAWYCIHLKCVYEWNTFDTFFRLFKHFAFLAQNCHPIFTCFAWNIRPIRSWVGHLTCIFSW